MKKHEKNMKKHEKNEILRNFEKKTPTRSRCPQVFFLSNQLSANYKIYFATFCLQGHWRSTLYI